MRLWSDIIRHIPAHPTYSDEFPRVGSKRIESGRKWTESGLKDDQWRTSSESFGACCTLLNTDFQSVRPEAEMLDKAELMAEHGGVSWQCNPMMIGVGSEGGMVELIGIGCVGAVDGGWRRNIIDRGRKLEAVKSGIVGSGIVGISIPKQGEEGRNSPDRGHPKCRWQRFCQWLVKGSETAAELWALEIKEKNRSVGAAVGVGRRRRSNAGQGAGIGAVWTAFGGLQHVGQGLAGVGKHEAWSTCGRRADT
ncbi:hypothetical protein F5887DRAFT_930318 [Amanita rubescens]|nr:hypothetical protein F5887DRAFT_930318 [Amanita rubescens]